MKLQKTRQTQKAFLDEILRTVREAIPSAKRKRPLDDLIRRIQDLEPPRNFTEAVSSQEKGRLRLIAEIKQASPSQGLLRKEFKPADLAKIYEEAGASALSVLTEERFFLGRLERIAEIRGAVRLPILRKDFLIDEYQIYEARAFEADAALLIVAALDDYQLKDYRAIAEGLGMASLVEVHTESELERALASGARILGINNRDLQTFETDLETTFRLAERIPEDDIVVSESGISTSKDIQRLAETGLDAVLIGETFMKSEDIQGKIRELFGGVWS